MNEHICSWMKGPLFFCTIFSTKILHIHICFLVFFSFKLLLLLLFFNNSTTSILDIETVVFYNFCSFNFEPKSLTANQSFQPQTNVILSKYLSLQINIIFIVQSRNLFLKYVHTIQRSIDG